tara:strand:- start:19328 stop:19597 length:270 start_codon:yes stop_codon:yes gene_type:complete
MEPFEGINEPSSLGSHQARRFEDLIVRLRWESAGENDTYKKSNTMEKTHTSIKTNNLPEVKTCSHFASRKFSASGDDHAPIRQSKQLGR